MGKVLYIMATLGAANPTYQNACMTSRGALMETSMMKDEVQEVQVDSEHALYYYTKLEPKDFTFLAYVYPLATGKISTKPIKGLEYKTVYSWEVRPDLEYSVQGNSAKAALTFTKTF